MKPSEINKIAELFYKFADIQVATEKPTQKPKQQNDVEYRDRFHGATGEERQKLIAEEAAKKGFTLVPTKKTPVTESQVIQSIKSIVDKKYPEMDEEVKKEFIFTIVPQIKAETGYVPYNYNMGNAHAYPGWRGKVSVWDDPQLGKDGKRFVNISWFWQAFSTLEEGVLAWFNMLERRFPAAFEKAKAGETEGFARELRAAGYYTERLEKYTKALKDVKEQMKKKYQNNDPFKKITTENFPAQKPATT